MESEKRRMKNFNDNINKRNNEQNNKTIHFTNI